MPEQGLSFFDLYWMPMLIALPFMILSMVIGSVLKNRFKRYSKVQLQSNFSGKEVAEKMLADYGIHDVRVTSVQGQLTDHYNPKTKTVNLSEGVFHGRNAASAAVAAHECGHAVQHATNYSMLQFRSALVPLQAISGMLMNVIVFGMIILGNVLYETFPVDIVLYALIAAQGAITLFSLVTLPVEFDASNRALAWIERTGVVNRSEYAMSKDALKWAAMTYVAAALAAVAQLLYYVVLLLNRD